MWIAWGDSPLLHVGNTRCICFYGSHRRYGAVAAAFVRRPQYRLVANLHGQFVLIAYRYQAITPTKLECASQKNKRPVKGLQAACVSCETSRAYC